MSRITNIVDGDSFYVSKNVLAGDSNHGPHSVLMLNSKCE